MIIEFTAIPGSGKTYLSSALAEVLTDSVQGRAAVFTSADLFERYPKPKYRISRWLQGLKARIVLLNPPAAGLLLRVFRSEHPWREKRRLLSYTMNILLRYSRMNHVTSAAALPSIFIMEEGALHLSKVFFDAAHLEEALPGFLKSISDITGIQDRGLPIFIDSNPEESFRRMEVRKQGWPRIWARRTKEEKLRLLEESQEAHEALCRFLQKQGTPCIIIDNSEFQEDFHSIFAPILLEVENRLKME